MEDKLYSQEELDAMVAEAVANATKNMIPQREFDKKVQVSVDKSMRTYKRKWEDEFKKQQAMTAEELAAEKIKTATADLEKRERALAYKSNQMIAKDMLVSAEIPSKHYEKILPNLINIDEEVTKTSVEAFIDSYKSSMTDIETRLKAELTSIPAPKISSPETTRRDFKKMSADERIKLKNENPDEFYRLMEEQKKNVF